jgi:hypothetical protein
VKHGRNHEQREQHVRTGRSQNTPDKDVWQVRMLSAGRTGGRPPEGLVGAHAARRAPTGDIDSLREREEEPVGAGAEVAPTPLAVARERERHARERALGRIAAGTEGRLRDDRRAGVTRADLERAARAADEAVRGRGRDEEP